LRETWKSKCDNSLSEGTVLCVFLSPFVRLVDGSTPGEEMLSDLIFLLGSCGEPAISLHFHHVSLIQWTTHLLPATRDPSSNPLGGTSVKMGFSC
jgi:hypothetical protein